MKKLGIIGGLGPMATVSFMRRIIDMTEAATDQEHMEIYVAHCPSIPDRTGYLLDRTKPDPAPHIIEAGRKLALIGADEIAIPCITAHAFHAQLQENIPIPVINGIKLTTSYLSDKGVTRAGVLATDGTVQTGIFANALNELGIEALYPSEASQRFVMELIYNDVKAGKPVEREKFEMVAAEMRERGAEVMILGCTELSVIADEWLPEGRFIDVLVVLAQSAVKDCGRLKEKYIDIIKEVKE